MASDDPVVGHKTMRDGSHVPLHKSEADVMLAAIAAAEAKRATAMPDEKTAISHMWDGWYRLKELGWKEAQYASPDGKTVIEVIEIGSTGIHECICSQAKDGYTKYFFTINDEGWPLKPTLYRNKGSRT